MADITMPQLGETVTEGTITKWHKSVGEEVKEDDVLFEVSTDKVDSEVPSPVSGTLTEIKAQEGDTVPVGAVIAVVGGSAGGSAEPAAAEPAPAEPAAAAAAQPSQAEPTAESIEQPAAESEAAAATSESARTADPVAGTGGAQLASTSSAPAQKFETAGKVLSPVVRRLLSENNIDPATLAGTGAGGRITRDDVMARISGGSGAAVPSNGAARLVDPSAGTPGASSAEPIEAPAPAPAASSPAPAAPRATPQPAAAVSRPAPIPAPPAGQRDSRIPFTNMRRRTAEHMVRSQATSAHTLVVVDVDFDNVDKVRLAAKDAFKKQEGASLTYLPFISRAVVDALREFPQLNASVGNDELIVHHDINLGFAVDLDFEGLIVPVVQQADGKRLRALTREIADLAKRARGKKLGADDIAGGTFTITNAGGYGTVVTYPVINQPQVAILSTDGVKKRPVVVTLPDGSDAIAIHPVGNLALAWDHRAVDGAYAAAFVARLREILETRDWNQELG